LIRGKLESLEASSSSQETARTSRKPITKGKFRFNVIEAHTPFTVLVDRKLEKVPDAKQKRAR
jgi:hypothetical protein